LLKRKTTKGNQIMKNSNTIFITIVIACFGFLPRARGVVPAPDGGYPGGNTAEGQNALLTLNVNTGINNTAVGFFSLKSNVDGQFNTALGSGTLFNNTSHRNTAIGGAAMFSNTVGSFNTAVGMLGLFSNSTGSSNTAVGDGALLNNSTGGFNTAIGRVALLSNTTGNGNTATGAQALVSNTTASQNTAYGYQAMLDNTTGAHNTAVGFAALGSNTIGEFNTAMGAQALASNTTGESNTAIGRGAASSMSTSSFNTVVGRGALNSLTSGLGNNTALGINAGEGLTIGSGNVYIGGNVSAGASGENDTTRIRNVYFSTVAARAVYVDQGGKLGTLSSSKRYKEEIKPMDRASETLFALKPVTFRYKKEIDPARALSFGLIAEEVAEVNPELITRDEEGKPQTVRHEAINAMLLNEFFKEHKKVQKQQREIDALKRELKEQRALIQKVSAQVELSKRSPRTALNDQ